MVEIGICSMCNEKCILKTFPCMVCSNPVSGYFCEKCTDTKQILNESYDIVDTCSDKCMNILKGNGSVISIRNAEGKVLCMIDDFDDVLGITIMSRYEMDKALSEDEKTKLRSNCKECEDKSPHKPNIYPFKCILCKESYTYDICCHNQYHDLDYVCDDCEEIIGDENETEEIMEKVYDIHEKIINLNEQNEIINEKPIEKPIDSTEELKNGQ